MLTMQPKLSFIFSRVGFEQDLGHIRGVTQIPILNIVFMSNTVHHTGITKPHFNLNQDQSYKQCTRFKDCAKVG